MSETLKTWWLTNGVVVNVADGSIPNSNNTWTAKLIIKATMDIKASYLSDFEDNPDYLEILSMLLPSAHYERDVTKNGIAEKDLETEKAALIDAFEKNALYYFERDDFPVRYVRKLYKELEKELARNKTTRERIRK